MGFNKGIAEGLLLALQLCGCVRETTLDAGLPRKVVVEFVLTDENVQNLYLSLTGEPGETVSSAVGEAEIKLLDVSQNMEMDQFVRVADNQWTLEYSGIPGHKYRLEIKVDGYDRVWAEQTMPEKAELPGLGYGLAVYFDLEPRLDYPDWGLYYSIEHIAIPSVIRNHCNYSSLVYIGFTNFERSLLYHINDSCVILHNVVFELKSAVLMEE